MTILWTGTCNCPNNCMSHLNQGICSNDQCTCRNGWSGRDCSIRSNQQDFNGLSSTPYPFLFGSPYSIHDKYGDNHPVFNISTMAVISVQMREEDMTKMYDYRNIYNQTFLKTTFNFNNGVLNKTFEKVGIRIKGLGSRFYTKKGIKFSFNAFDKEQRFFGLKRIDLKGKC
jgi:hypothetical protein